MKDVEYQHRIVVTGGAGFIGSNLLRYLVPRYPNYLFINLDCLTYAGNLANLSGIDTSHNYHFERVSICDFPSLRESFDKHQPDAVIHLAAETHVDRSIENPGPFIETNITGTYNLLELARQISRARSFRFYHVSTDEVFGSIPTGERAVEDRAYKPSSPYSASKAASDHLVRAYGVTFGMDTVMSRSSNNYGPYQFPEKLVPLMIRNGREGLPLPVYGDGRQIRDWLYVEDHCKAIDAIFHRGKTGAVYNIGSGEEVANLDLVTRLCHLMDARLGGGQRAHTVAMVADRPGHDRRYALDTAKIQAELGWRPQAGLEEGLRLTLDWYLENWRWLEGCLSGEYLQYYQRMYGQR